MNGDHWVAELAIPFKSIRFNENQKQWNVNFYRIDSENAAEQSTWSPIPRNFGIINLATLKKMSWDEPYQKTWF